MPYDKRKSAETMVSNSSENYCSSFSTPHMFYVTYFVCLHFKGASVSYAKWLSRWNIMISDPCVLAMCSGNNNKTITTKPQTLWVNNAQEIIIRLLQTLKLNQLLWYIVFSCNNGRLDYPLHKHYHNLRIPSNKYMLHPCLVLHQFQTHT